MPRIDFRQPLSGGGVSDHGALTGLADDDHSQYLTAAEALPGQAAHYIGTWAIGTAYAAGECVRHWGGSAFKLYQAKVATTGDNPTSVAASWAEVTIPIVMWGSEHPITTDSANAHGPGITAPLGTVYLHKTADGYNGALFQSAGSGWTAGTQVSAISGAGQNVTLAASLLSDLEGDGDGTLDASIRADNSVIGTGDMNAGITAGRRGDGDGSVSNSITAMRDGTGTGNALAIISGNILDDAVGMTISGTQANHHAGGIAHVFPTANATEAFNEVQGPFDIIEQADAAAPAAGHGRIYMRDNGSGKMQFVARFPSGAVQVIATEP